jgi:two-component system nitrate/nitrite response regulator NarL
MISVVVVDDHPLFREGLIQAVMVEHDIKVIGEGQSAAQAVDLVQSLKPDIILLDVRMKDSGIGRIGDITVAHPAVRIIMLTASEDEDDIAQALAAGVSGYVLKGTTGPDMRNIIRSVYAGENYLPKHMVGRLLSVLKHEPEADRQEGDNLGLSGQETQALQALALGLNNREIGTRLGITERTVKFHLSNAFVKLKVRNRVEASIVARKIWSEIKP